MQLFEQLNPEQIRPVQDTQGAVLVLAGAGSGKTRVLTSRIAYLVEEKSVLPGNVLAITFTNKAANEMKERLSAMIPNVGSMWICTIHSMCTRILRLYGEEIGYGKNFSIYSETERASLIKKAHLELGAGDDKELKNIKFHIARAKMLGLSPSAYSREIQAERGAEKVIEVYSLYQKKLRESNALDFDDLLSETLRLLQERQDVCEFLSNKFQYIHVDEFQDTNEVQFNIITLLSKMHGNLFCVGDDDQSIYGWRGAKIENILEFEKKFPHATVYKLEQNYRSTKNILKLANAIIHNNDNRKDKTLWTSNNEGIMPELYSANEEADEARFAARKIQQYVRNGGRYSDCAILMRMNALTRSYEQEFLSDSIPYRVFGGFKFYERKEIKDILAYLRVINNPQDSEALERIINVPKRGIGSTTIDKLNAYARLEDDTLYFALTDVRSVPNLTNAAVKKIEPFAHLLKDLIYSSIEQPVDQFVRTVIDRTAIRSQFTEPTEENRNKLANIDEFISSVDEFSQLNPDASLSDYLNQVTLSSDTDDMGDDNYVTLATVHAVKGLEFKLVVICGLEEGIFPVSRASYDDDELEEERRLMYVAITRARQLLYLSHSQSRFMYGKRDASARSQFIDELEPVLGIEPPKRSSFYQNDWGYSSYSGYGGYERTRSVGTEYRYPSATHTHSTQKPTPAKAPVRAVQKPAQSHKVDLSEFKIGKRVRHPKFGEGVIVETKNGSENLILSIKFDTAGTKALAARLAPLTLLD